MMRSVESIRIAPLAYQMLASVDASADRLDGDLARLDGNYGIQPYEGDARQPHSSADGSSAHVHSR
jgi:hypothetical protein